MCRRSAAYDVSVKDQEWPEHYFATNGSTASYDRRGPHSLAADSLSSKANANVHVCHLRPSIQLFVGLPLDLRYLSTTRSQPNSRRGMCQSA